jgi:Capsular polysaccharide biosynthesis protein
MPGDITDIHSHLLPGIDDGAADWDETRQMLQLAYEQGIHTIIATPHFSRRHETGHLRELAGRLAAEARKIAPDYRIYLGQELMYFDSLVEFLERGDALTLADTRYVLVEFRPDVTYKNLYQWIRKLLMAGYHPVIAHVERYLSLRKDDRLRELIQAGCYLQMNYSSLNGAFFHPDIRWCRNQLRNNLIHFMATDMHHINYRAPVIRKSLQWMERSLEAEQVALLTGKHAKRLLTGQLLT